MLAKFFMFLFGFLFGGIFGSWFHWYILKLMHNPNDDVLEVGDDLIYQDDET